MNLLLCGACRDRLQRTKGLVRLIIATNLSAAIRSADLLQNVSVTSNESIDTIGYA